MKFQQKEYCAQGIKMNYYIFGSGRPILFLHGGAVNALTYKKSLQLLAEKNLIIAPDIPCFGKSDTPNNQWDFNDFVKFFSDFVDALPHDELILIGHSFGGGIALNLASFNSKISRLVLIDSAGVCPDYSYCKFFYLLAKKSFNGLFIDFLIETKILKDFFLEFGVKIFSSIFIYNIIKKTIFNDSVPDGVKCPTQILWGIKDELFDQAYANKLNSLIKNSKLEFIEGNHDWCSLKPYLFVDVINKIIDQNKI